MENHSPHWSARPSPPENPNKTTAKKKWANNRSAGGYRLGWTGPISTIGPCILSCYVSARTWTTNNRRFSPHSPRFRRDELYFYSQPSSQPFFFCYCCQLTRGWAPLPPIWQRGVVYCCYPPRMLPTYPTPTNTHSFSRMCCWLEMNADNKTTMDGQDGIGLFSDQNQKRNERSVPYYIFCLLLWLKWHHLACIAQNHKTSSS